MPKVGDKIIITDKILPDYGETFVILYKISHAKDLWGYNKEENISKKDLICKYAGSSQFKVVNEDIV